MATLDAAPTLPNPLSHENPLTRNAHVAQIPAWVVYLLRTTIESNVHYESQLHGPIGVQAALRESPVGKKVLRFPAGREINKLLPDFLTVNGILRPSNHPREYRIISVVELKRNDDDQGKSEAQRLHYMMRINQIAGPNNNFRGFLVMQDNVQVYGYSGYGASRMAEIVDEYNIFAPGNHFITDLTDIAIAYWN